MTTLRDLVQKSLRECGIIAVGTEPDADVFEETLSHLQTLIKSLFGNEFGDPLVTYDIGQSGVTTSELVTLSTSIPSNTRLIFNLNASLTMTLPAFPNDGARLQVIDNIGNFSTNNLTLLGNGRRIENATTLLLNTDLLNRSWFYRDDLGGWTKITDLTADDPSPFPDEFDDFLITLLAIRVNPRYGAETHQETEDILKRARSQFRARYSQTTEMPGEDALYRLPSTRYYIQIGSFARGN